MGRSPWPIWRMGWGLRTRQEKKEQEKSVRTGRRVSVVGEADFYVVAVVAVVAVVGC